jgi:DegV family protein with EDD domain
MGAVYAVLTDSTCDLPPEQALKLGLHVIPLTVQLQERRLLDWQEIDPDAVYDHMRTGGTATTAPVAAAAFAERYRQLLATHDGVVSIHLSGKLSETVNNARQAAESLGETGRITVIDSELASTPLAEAALAVRDVLQAGGDGEAARRAVEAMRGQMQAEFSVASLEYLRRGGRIGRAQALVGNMLGVRPILQFDHGELKAVRRIRASQAAEDMLDQLCQKFGREAVSVSIVHAGRDTGRLSAMRQAVTRSGLNVRQGRVQLMGPVIGAHVGPGTYGFLARPFQMS